MKALLVGEAPSRSGDRERPHPLAGPPARTICGLAGIERADEGLDGWTLALYDHFQCENVFDRYAAATPWSVPAARERAATLRVTLSAPVVVLLGRRVAAAMGCDAAPLFEWFDFAVPARGSVVPAVVLPHPSGLNRALNDRRTRDRAGATLRMALLRAMRDPVGS